jgi:energy-coupling factor transport system ATP-binding protein
MIKVKDLHFKYVGRKAEALQGVNLHIRQGETVLLLGPTGSGKSTLALCLNGLIPQVMGGRMNGRVCIAGLDTWETPISELTQQVGIVFQDPESQFVTMTVEDEIAFGLENLRVPPEEMDGYIREALARVGMTRYRRRRVDALSNGEKQRLALATLLAMRPRILVFDEPTANLDPVGTREVFETINQLKRTGRYTIILVEHKLDELMHLVDWVVALTHNGNILTDGPPQAVFRDQAEALLEHGIWMPQTALLAHRLRGRGMRLEPFPITLEQAEQALLQVTRGKNTQYATRNPKHATRNPALSEAEGTPHETNDPPPAIQVRNLSFSYDGPVVLDDINLRVPQGDFLAIVGANGAGKTTLAQHLIDVLHPPRGSVLLEGSDVTRIPARDLIRRVGYVFQNPEHQFITESVKHELSFGLRLMGLPEAEIETRVGALLEQFGLSHLARANPFTLSQGEKRRLSVATMLAVGQETLILDEPTFGQDQRNAEALMQMLSELHAAGRTVIIITHDMTLVAEYTQHVAVMIEGQLRFHGLTAEVFARPELLAQARLTLPPLAELSRRLAAHHPTWGGLLTVDQFLAAFTTVQEMEN